MTWTPVTLEVCNSGTWHLPPYYSRDSLFSRPLDGRDVLAADQTPAHNLANQAQYGKQGHTFFGYSGVGYGNYPWPGSLGFNVDAYSFPLYAVRPSDPHQNISMQKVGLYLPNNGSPYLLGNQYGNLQSYCLSVPIPDKTLCPRITGVEPYVDIFSSGEHGCVIWNLDTDEAWEFYQMSNTGPASMQQAAGCTWLAEMAAYIPAMTKFSGAFGSMWGARGTSLGASGGVITMQDLRDVQAGGRINHALCIGCAMNGGIGSQVAPATRADGPGSNNVPHIPSGYPGAGGANPAYHLDTTHEGARSRFATSVDLSGCAHPLSLAMAGAIRDHGLLIVDTSGAVGFYMEDRRTLSSPYHVQGAGAADPWTLAWPGGDPLRPGGINVLTEIPWDQLQAVQP